MDLKSIDIKFNKLFANKGRDMQKILDRRHDSRWIIMREELQIVFINLNGSINGEFGSCICMKRIEFFIIWN